VLVECHASTLSSWFWCGRKAVEQLHGVYPKWKSGALVRGGEVHGWLEGRPKGERERELAGRLESFKVASKFREGRFFHRVFQDFDVYGAVDDFVLESPDLFRIIEHKTIARPERAVKKWYVSPYVFQVQLYCWILEPTLKELGLKLAWEHFLYWHDSASALPAHCPTCQQLIPCTVVQPDGVGVERQLEVIRRAYSDPKEIVYPTIAWKCERCDEIYREKCPRGNAVLG
jgi:hypothetical protein